MERLPKHQMLLLLTFAILHLCLGTSFFARCGGAASEQSTPREQRKVKMVSRMDSPNDDPYNYAYAGSPFRLPPYDDVMGSPSPSSLPQHDDPVYCVYPPPPPPATACPSPPTTGIPPPASTSPSPPTTGLAPPPPPPSPPSPPQYPLTPSPPIQQPSPPGPIIVNPTPSTPPPTHEFPSPPQFVPAPPVFQPPIVYPPPSVPPPPSSPGTNYNRLWCVAKPSVPDPIIQEAMNYACGSGADCDSIQPNGSCYEPNTLIAHASFAFNSYWQRTRVVGGTCDFGGTAMLVTKDPSFDGCHFQRA